MRGRPSGVGSPVGRQMFHVKRSVREPGAGSREPGAANRGPGVEELGVGESGSRGAREVAVRGPGVRGGGESWGPEIRAPRTASRRSGRPQPEPNRAPPRRRIVSDAFFVCTCSHGAY